MSDSKQIVDRLAKCELCGLELDTEQDDVGQVVTGWVDADGNLVEELVERHNRWAHWHCVEEAERQQQA